MSDQHNAHVLAWREWLGAIVFIEDRRVKRPRKSPLSANEINGSVTKATSKEIIPMGRPASCRAALFLSWASRVFLSVWELRHITLPRIDLHCPLLPNLRPVANGGSSLAPSAARRRVPHGARFVLSDRRALQSPPAKPAPAGSVDSAKGLLSGPFENPRTVE
jgi:hypothetical protein